MNDFYMFLRALCNDSGFFAVLLSALFIVNSIFTGMEIRKFRSAARNWGCWDEQEKKMLDPDGNLRHVRRLQFRQKFSMILGGLSFLALCIYYCL